MEGDGLLDLGPDGLHGIERPGRLLENESDLAAPDVSPLALGEREELATPVGETAGDLCPFGRKAEQGARQLRFA